MPCMLRALRDPLRRLSPPRMITRKLPSGGFSSLLPRRMPIRLPMASYAPSIFCSMLLLPPPPPSAVGSGALHWMRTLTALPAVETYSRAGVLVSISSESMITWRTGANACMRAGG